MSQVLNRIKRLSKSALLSLFIAILLLVAVGTTINNALKIQDKNTPLVHAQALGQSTSQQVTPTLYCLGSCPTNLPQKEPTPNQMPPVKTQQPVNAVSPITNPCTNATTQNTTEAAHAKEKEKEKKSGFPGNIFQKLLQLLQQFFQLLQQLLGQNPGTPIQPTPAPLPEQLAPIGQPTNVPCDPTIAEPTPTPASTAPTNLPVIPTSTPTPIGNPATSPTPATSQSPTPSTTNKTTWSLQSVDAMKVTKDVICSQADQAYIEHWVDKAVEIGATHVAISTPYDNPSCGNAAAYTKLWIKIIRSKGLKVWHRHMPLAFEGIYDTPKNASADFLNQISQYIKTNKDDFQEGDILTPVPEPQNGGIQGFSYCPQNICIFSSIASFNKWLRDGITISNDAFTSIGLGGKVKTGYYGFDGFVAWGHNNPDWNGILEDATVQAMGNITVDHYPEAVGTSMGPDLKELEQKYPNTPIIIGEWGTISGSNLPQQVQNTMSATAADKNVVGFNYWTLGPGAQEALVNDSNWTNYAHFQNVKSFFKP